MNSYVCYEKTGHIWVSKKVLKIHTHSKEYVQDGIDELNTTMIHRDNTGVAV